MIRLTPKQGQLVSQTLKGMSGEFLRATGQDKILEQIDAQLQQPHHATELVEVIAGLLAPERGRIVVLSGKLLAAMRDAILNPKELAQVKALAKSHQACFNCGRDVAAGEIVSLHGQLAYCWQCVAPTTITCQKCNNVHPLGTQISRFVTKLLKECGFCKQGITKKQDEEKQPDDAATIRFRDLADRVLTQRPRPGRAITNPEPTWTVTPTPTNGQWATTFTHTDERRLENHLFTEAVRTMDTNNAVQATITDNEEPF